MALAVTTCYASALWLFWVARCEAKRAAANVSGGPVLCDLGAECGHSCKAIYFIRHAEGRHQVANKAYASSEAGSARIADLKAKIGELKKAEESSGQHVAELSQAQAELRTHENWATWHENPAAGEMLDAELTEKGKQDCLAKRSIPLLVQLVVTSPFRRALETAYWLFVGRHDRFLVHDLLRCKIGQFLCDKRHALEENRLWKPAGLGNARAWEDWDWSTQQVSPFEKERAGYPFSERDAAWSTRRESAGEVERRGEILLRWLHQRTETDIAVVTHSGFMKHLFGSSETPKNIEPMKKQLCLQVS